MQTIEVPPHFNFHYANAYEEADGSIIIGERNYPTLSYVLNHFPLLFKFFSVSVQFIFIDEVLFSWIFNPKTSTFLF